MRKKEKSCELKQHIKSSKAQIIKIIPDISFKLTAFLFYWDNVPYSSQKHKENFFLKNDKSVVYVYQYRTKSTLTKYERKPYSLYVIIRRKKK